MAVSKELIEILMCPVCKTDLTMKDDGSGLKCNTCKRLYTIVDDIPNMIPDQAAIEE